MRNPAPPAGTSGQLAPPTEADATKASGAGLPTAGTGAGDMTPVEAALLQMSGDLGDLLSLSERIIEQGKALKSCARLMLADIQWLREACRPCNLRMKEKPDD